MQSNPPLEQDPNPKAQTKTERIIKVNQMQKKLSVMKSNLEATAKNLESCIEEHFNQQIVAIDKIYKLTHEVQTKIQDNTLSFKDQYLKQHNLPEFTDEAFAAWFLQKDPPESLKDLAEESRKVSKENANLTQENAIQHSQLEKLKDQIRQQDRIIQNLKSLQADYGPTENGKRARKE